MSPPHSLLLCSLVPNRPLTGTGPRPGSWSTPCLQDITESCDDLLYLDLIAVGDLTKFLKTFSHLILKTTH